MSEASPPSPGSDRTPRWRRHLWDGLILVLAGYAVITLFRGRDAALPVGTAVPALELTTLRDGVAVPLAARAGRPLLLVFWATWCPACREELPALAALSRQYGDRGLEVLAVSDEVAARVQVEALVRARAPGLRVALEQGAARAAFQVTTLPTNYLIDGQGRVAWSRVGATGAAGLGAAVEAVLSAPAATDP